MRAQNLLMGILLFVAMPMASAETLLPAKPGLRADFNKMIDEGNHNKKNLQQVIEKKAVVQAELEEENAADRKKVIDFVDVEVGWGNEPGTVVDRRFDSVSEPQIFDVTTLFDLQALIYGRPAKLSPEI